MIWLRKTCKETTRLLVAREDRDLGWTDRLALRLHLMACQTCPRFERQMLTLRTGLRQWRHYTDENGPTSGGPQSK